MATHTEGYRKRSRAEKRAARPVYLTQSHEAIAGHAGASSDGDSDLQASSRHVLSEEHDQRFGSADAGSMVVGAIEPRPEVAQKQYIDHRGETLTQDL